jgi:hypothetical protein
MVDHFDPNPPADSLQFQRRSDIAGTWRSCSRGMIVRQDQACCINPQRHADEQPKFQFGRARKTARKRLAPGQPSRSIKEKDMNEFVLPPAIKTAKVGKKLCCLGNNMAQLWQTCICWRMSTAVLDIVATI